MKDQTPAKVVSRCPQGHKIRAEISRTGDLVSCPRCQTEFVFGVRASESPSVTDTSVMRILGTSSASDATSVEQRVDTVKKTCEKCNAENDESATVCKHCNSYVGSLPGFMKSLLSGDSFSEN